MTTQTISDIEQALRRISTGWRVAIIGNGFWSVYNDGTLECSVHDEPTEAKAEYLRLTEAAS